MGRDPSLALATVQIDEPLDGKVGDEMGVQSGLEVKCRPLV